MTNPFADLGARQLMFFFLPHLKKKALRFLPFKPTPPLFDAAVRRAASAVATLRRQKPSSPAAINSNSPNRIDYKRQLLHYALPQRLLPNPRHWTNRPFEHLLPTSSSEQSSVCTSKRSLIPTKNTKKFENYKKWKNYKKRKNYKKMQKPQKMQKLHKMQKISKMQKLQTIQKNSKTTKNAKTTRSAKTTKKYKNYKKCGKCKNYKKYKKCKNFGNFKSGVRTVVLANHLKSHQPRSE